MMKTLMKYSLVGIVSMTVGVVLGWQAFSYKIRLRVIPFDRSQNVLIELMTLEPTLDFNFAPDGNTFNGLGQKEGTVEEDLDSRLARAASFSTSIWVIASFNRDVTVQQIRDIDERIRKFGFPHTRMLIEDNRSNRAEGEERLFSEIRIGQLKDFYWHNVEWYIDGMQEEATKRMKNQRSRDHKTATN